MFVCLRFLACQRKIFHEIKKITHGTIKSRVEGEGVLLREWTRSYLLVKGQSRNSGIIRTALFMLFCLGCLYIFIWLFAQELDKHCEATVHQLFFNSEQLFALTTVMSLFCYFKELFFLFCMPMTSWRMAALCVNADVLMDKSPKGMAYAINGSKTIAGQQVTTSN